MLTAYAATATDAAGKVSDGTVAKLAWVLDLLTEKIPLWIAAFILIFVFMLVARIARKIIEEKLADKGIDEDHQEVQILGGRIAYAVVLTLGITVSLKVAGIDLTTIIAAVGFGIGFALRDLIMNFLAGIMILVSRHFTVGDFIKVGGTMGKIIEIQGRNTILQAIDGTKVIVPNADLFNNQVTSMTSNPFRRIEVGVGFDYRTDLKNAIKVCMKAIKKTKGILLQPKPAIVVDGFGASSIDMRVRVWVESRSAWLKTKGNLILNLNDELGKYNISMPYPITSIIYDKDTEVKEKMMEEEKEEKVAMATPKVQITGQVAVAPETSVPAQAPAAPLIPAAVQAVDFENPEDEEPLKPLGELYSDNK